jgi:ABC-type multidrug transport system fused ATPase/permease subunit
VKATVGLRDLLPYLRPHRRTLAAVGALTALGSVLALASPLLTREVLDAVREQRPTRTAVVLLLLSVVGGALVAGLERYLLQRTAEGVVLGARTQLAAHVLRLPVAEHDARRSGDLLSRVGADTTQLHAAVTSGLFQLVSGAVIVAGAVVAMLLLDPLLLAVTLSSVGVAIALVIGVSRRVRLLSTLAQARVGDMTAAVERALGAVRTIRASGAEERETTAVVGSARAAYDAGLRSARLSALVSPVSSLAVQGSFLLVLALGGARVARGELTVADLVAFVLYLFLLVLPLAQALQAWTTLQAGLGALQRVEEVRRLPAEDGGGAADLDLDTDAPLLELRDVDFAYATGGPVLSGVTFTVARGTRTALVGPSGAGKSTVLALVERFYDVTAGSILVGGTDVCALPRARLRDVLGYVEQEAPALAGSLRDNLRMAAPASTDADLHAVIDAVNLRDLVDRAPAGLDTEVGDGGVLLSGGERQRLAIARSLLAAPPLLLLDEPTSNLDARNEAALRAAVDAVARDRTLLVVAHRLSTVVDADQIVVLDQGRVVAVGRHDELVETSPLYRELAAHQLLVPQADADDAHPSSLGRMTVLSTRTSFEKQKR